MENERMHLAKADRECAAIARRALEASTQRVRKKHVRALLEIAEEYYPILAKAEGTDNPVKICESFLESATKGNDDFLDRPVWPGHDAYEARLSNLKNNLPLACKILHNLVQTENN